ncbi:MAG: PTS sugar transporter subunit IIA [Candidatus Cloacimonetes bacterium]|nr:PTS sugar transporter subunit IIA [Candidatus Cloacimonadota bacterium]
MWKEVTKRELIIINPVVKNKQDLFEKMINLAYNSEYIKNKKMFSESLYSREKMANTELFPEVAIPHARCKSVDKLFLCIIISNEGIDYDNPALGKVKIVFFFGCPEEQNKEYLKYLAMSSRLLKNAEFRNRLLNAKNSEEVIQLLTEFSLEDSGHAQMGSYLLLMVLNETDKLTDVISAFIETGITNAAITDSVSMAKKLAYDLPLFAGLGYMAKGKSISSKIITAQVSEKGSVDKIANILLQNGVDLNRPGTGYIQLLPIIYQIGTTEEDIDI